jgi:hypothetical protein
MKGSENRFLNAWDSGASGFSFETTAETVDGSRTIEALHAQRFHYNWYWVWDTGNGDLGNQGIHELGVLRWGECVRAVEKRRRGKADCAGPST